MVDFKVMRDAFSKKASFSDIAPMFGFGRDEFSVGYFGKKSIYCPFHQNVDTRAASIFRNKDGSESIYCYAEHRCFSPFDMVEAYSRSPREKYRILMSFWNSLDPATRMEFESSTEQATVQDQVLKRNEFAVLDGYKHGKMDYIHFLQEIGRLQ